MKKIDISKLLQTLSPELVANYEGVHLSGRTLQSVNEEYNSVKKDPDQVLLKWIRIIMLFFVVAIIWIIATGMILNFRYLPYLGLLTLIIPTLILHIIIRPKIKKDIKILSQCDMILEDFQKAVGDLNPFSTAFNDGTRFSIGENLVMLAVKKLEAEARFDKARMSVARHITEIQVCLNDLISSDEAFELVLSTAKDKFGIEYVKRDLFIEAQKRIDNWGERSIAD